MRRLDDNDKQQVSHLLTALAIAMLLGVLMALAGCKASQKATSNKVELVRGVEFLTDSTNHLWQVYRVTLYDGGQVARVDEVEHHSSSEVVKYVRDTLHITHTDTLYMQSDYTPTAQVAKSVNSSLALILAIALVVCTAIMFVVVKIKKG